MRACISARRKSLGVAVSAAPMLCALLAVELVGLELGGLGAGGVGLGVLVEGNASAQESDVASAYQRAEQLEHDGRPAEALEAWREVTRLGAGSRMAARASRRITWLEERSEDHFSPLEALLAFQQREDRSLEAADAFARVVETMPAGRVRIESRLALAQAFGSVGQTDRATEIYRTLLDETDLREDEARLARDELAGVIAEGGDVDAALHELESSGLGDSARHGVLMRGARRRFLEPMAWAFVALFVVVIVFGIHRVRGLSRARAALSDPWAIATCTLVAAGPYLIARWIGDEATGAFAVLGLANLLGLALSFAAGGAFRGAPPHTIRALSFTAVLAALGAGYLAALYQAQSLPFA